MSLIGRVLLAIWGYSWAVLCTVVFAFTYFVVALFYRGVGWMDLMQRGYMFCVLTGVGVRLRVQGREHISKDTAYVVMGNHRSYLDIPAVVTGLRDLTILFVAKKELLRRPFLGWALSVSHHIKVDRKSREQAVPALQKAARRIRSGIGLMIFPEGTRSLSDKPLPFKKGGFYVAVDAGFPILPVSIRNSGHLFGKKDLLPRVGTITIRVHAPVSVEGMTRADIPELMRTVRETIVSGLPEGVQENEAAAGSKAARP